MVRAAVHPLRLRVLELMLADEQPRSPAMLAKALDQPVGNVAYHVRAMAADGWLILKSRKQRRGAIEHFYVVSRHMKVQWPLDIEAQVLDESGVIAQFRDPDDARRFLKAQTAARRPLLRLHDGDGRPIDA